MSERDPLPDELLSAYLDGEATPEDAARIERDPELLARVGELAAVRDAVRSDVPAVDDATREATLARVLSEFEHEAPPAVLTTTTQLARRRRDPGRVLATAAAAVIAIALLGGAIGMLSRESSGGDDSSADAGAGLSTSLAEDGEQQQPGDADAEAYSSAEAAEQGSNGPLRTAAASLGSFADEEQLRQAVRSRLLSPAPGEDAGEDDSLAPEDRAPIRIESACSAPDGTRTIHVADLSGRSVLVVVTEGDLALVIDPRTCTEVLRITPQ
jgi:negative regulator of sigma E activity